MRITNKYNLPEPLVKACAPYELKQGRYSVSELISPAYQARLKRLHWNELEEDVSDRLWAIMGSAMHGVLAEHGQENELTEEKLEITVGDLTIVGKPDTYTADGTLSDWKFTSSWSHGEVKPEWEAQLNLYALLLERHGWPVKALRIVAIYRDWGRRHERDGIPHAAVIPVNLWPVAQREEYLRERIAEHQSEKPPLCTPEERWSRPSKLAVMKKGRKSALKLCESDMEAEMVMEQMGGTHIEKRPGEEVRCMGYCPVKDFCEYGKTLK